MSEKRTPAQVLELIKNKLGERAELEARIQCIEEILQTLEGEVADLFPMNVTRRFKAGYSFDLQIFEVTRTPDGLIVSFEKLPSLDSLQWPEPPTVEDRGQVKTDEPEEETPPVFQAAPGDVLDFEFEEASTEPPAALEPAVASIDDETT